ncbi:hypothetical protein LIN78_04585 [Leeia sp. TBRC 13508]|uniref:Uncharacterized protein n=1 Tax=Leeia speluncae TaxID=2884804 RepID=A0ABS8D3R8_9NEIS|nr:hypothetical protein [Leeia speluncae]MCB6182825.1 hypothetical protein [Leeia speluncae]
MLAIRFSNEQIEKIRSEALFYQCACPAQVCVSIASLRGLYEYQQNCLSDTSKTENEVRVHSEIAASVRKAHAEMEACLDTVLTLEGWDRNTFEMPEGLRIKLTEDILSTIDKKENKF